MANATTDPTIEELLNLGQMGLELGYWLQAEAYFEQVLQREPRHAQAMLGKAKACRNPRKALKIVRALLTVDPTLEEAHRLERDLQERVSQTLDPPDQPRDISPPSQMRREPDTPVGYTPSSSSPAQRPISFVYLLLGAVTMVVLSVVVLPQANRLVEHLAALTDSSQTSTTRQTAYSTQVPMVAEPDVLVEAQLATALILVPDPLTGQVQQGSGVTIDRMGLILTNHHVMAAPSGTLVNTDGLALVGFATNERQPPEEWYVAGAVVTDATRDLAVLRVLYTVEGRSVHGGSFEEMPLGNVTVLKLGQPLISLGYPALGGETVTLTRGSMAGFSYQEGGVRMGKTDSEMLPGSSGGAVLDEKGQLVGIITSSSAEYRTQGRLSYFVLVDEALDLIERARRSPRPSPSVRWIKEFFEQSAEIR